MPLSWNEIKDRALKFSKEWSHETREHAEAKLAKAHQQLDRAVDLCYRPQPFPNETARIEYLFDLYNEYTQP